MSEDDIFADISEEFDVNLTPTLHHHGSPRVSSGVSSCSSVSQSVPSPIVGLEFTCSYERCKKSYKTKRGYERHVFLHLIMDMNSRKPDMQMIGGAMDDIVFDIFEEIKNEPGSPEEKIKIVEDIQRSRQSPDWVHFLFAVSEPIMSAITERKKLLPANQYEEFLANLNSQLNKPGYLQSLKLQVSLLLSDKGLDNSPFIGMILFRLCFRLSEEIQIIVLKQMSGQKVIEPPAVPSQNTLEKKLFCDKMSSVIRIYFTKAASLKTEVWKARCDCIRHRFIEFVDESLQLSDVTLKTHWAEGNIILREEILEFCQGAVNLIDCKIRKYKDSISIDSVVKTILEPPTCEFVNKWHSLTSGYLSDIDSVIFMRDLVAILIKLSLRSEESKLKQVQDERQKLQKFSIRDNLKRN